MDLALVRLLENVLGLGLMYFQKLAFECRVGDLVYTIGHPLTGPNAAQFPAITRPNRKYYDYHVPIDNPECVGPGCAYIDSGLVTGGVFSSSPIINTAIYGVGVHHFSTFDPRSVFVSHETLSQEVQF